MKIIISPAKKINVDTDTFEAEGLPEFLDDTRILLKRIRGFGLEEAKGLWKCNDKLARLNFERFQDMDLEKCLTPAVMAYEGIQYQYLAPRVLTGDGLSYLKDHVRILSGFYGMLRPFDGVVPYRLEMQARLQVNGCRDLYEFWGDRLYRSLVKDDRVIVNLASKEYSQCIRRYVTSDDRFITIAFGEMAEGKVRQKGTLAKMARGEMVRFLAQRWITDLAGLKGFRGLGFAYSDVLSDEETFVFAKDETSL